MNQLQFAFIKDAQRTNEYHPQVQQQRSVAVTSFAMAAAVVATLAFGLHTSSAKSVITVAVPASKAVAVAPAPSQPAALPVARLETVVVRPTAQQLAEVEQLRKTRLAKAAQPAAASVVAGAAAAGL